MAELTTDQKIDALYEKFVLGVDPLNPTPAPTPGKDWWNPGPNQAISFAAFAGTTPENVNGWTGQGPNTAQTKIPALVNPSEDQAKAYATFGYTPNGTHYIWTAEGLVNARKRCDAIHKCENPQQADALIPGAGAPGVTEDAIEFAIMTGLIPEQQPLMPAPEYRILLPGGEGQLCLTVSDLLAYFANQPVGPGPGPGVV